MKEQIKDQNFLRKKIKFNFISFLFFLLIFTSSCEDELIIESNESLNESFAYKTVPLGEALESFQRGGSNFSKLKNNLDLEPDFSKIRQGEIGNTNEFVTIIPATTKNKNIITNVMLIKYNDSIIKVLINKIPDQNSTTNEFTGILSITHLNGKFINGYRLKNGKFISQFRKKSKENSSSLGAKLLDVNPEEEDECDESLDPYSIFCLNLLEEVNLGTPEGNTDNGFVLKVTPDTDTIKYYNPTEPTGGGSSGPDGNGTAGVKVFPCDDPIHGCDKMQPINIINNLTDPCAKIIFTELENGLYTEHPIKPEIQIPNTGILNFSESILKLFNDSDKTHYTIQNGSLTNKNASTDPTTNVTTISDNYLQNATQLSIARTMIHESVHAYINSTTKRLPGFVNMSFLQKMQAYAREKGITDTGRFHHEFMGEVVNGMAYSLYEWDKRYGSGGGDLGWNYYKAMAYAGLSYVKKDAQGNPVLDNNGNSIRVDTDSFKVLVPNKTDRDKIKKTISNEATGENAKGKKC